MKRNLLVITRGGKPLLVQRDEEKGLEKVLARMENEEAGLIVADKLDALYDLVGALVHAYRRLNNIRHRYSATDFAGMRKALAKAGVTAEDLLRFPASYDVKAKNDHS